MTPSPATTRADWRRWTPLALPAVLAALAAAWAMAAGGQGWWAQALRNELMIRCGLLLAGCTLGLQVVLLAMARLAARPRRTGLLRDQGGVAMVEFALLFPIAMVIVLVMVQVAMMMAGSLFVHYAAYCAARSAVVCIPSQDARQFPSEARNELLPPDQSAKLLWIQQSAAMALLPVAGTPPLGAAGAQGEANTIRQGMQRVYNRAGGGNQPRGWLGSSLERRYAYARDHTFIEVAPAGNAAQYAPGEDIRVTVRHELYLGVPYVNRLFGRVVAPGECVYDVSVTYTLVNQGQNDEVEVIRDPNGNVVKPRDL